MPFTRLEQRLGEAEEEGETRSKTTAQDGEEKA
jgi:hypothetical protein